MKILLDKVATKNKFAESDYLNENAIHDQVLTPILHLYNV